MFSTGLVTLFLLAAPCFAAVIDNTVEDDWNSCGERDDPLACLGVRAVASLDRAARMADINVLPGVTLVKEKDVRSGRALMTPRELEDSLPQDPSERSSRLLDLFYDSALRFLQSHSLNLRLPEDAPETLQRALEEGRGKMKKKLLPILMFVGVKLMALLPLALGVIGLMAVKALFVGKLAFIIAAIIAFQKFFASGAVSSFGKSPEVWTGGSSGWSTGSSSSGGPYYRRSLDAHNMAYSAQAPHENNSQ